MQQITLKAEPRESGKGSAHRVRAEGYVPAIVYGKNTSNVSLKVSGRELGRALHTGAGRNNLFRVEVGGEEPRTCIIKEVQTDPVTGRVIHIDLFQISLKDRITTSVTIVLHGEEAVEKTGGILQHGLRELEIECLPTDIPEHIVVDVSALRVGQHVTAGEVKLPEGVELVSEPEEVVVSVVAPKHAEVEETEAATGAAEPELVKKKAADEDEKEDK
ncbi:MAG: 50S ribosomal protein L25 [Chloroflexota bacterium]